MFQRNHSPAKHFSNAAEPAARKRRGLCHREGGKLILRKHERNLVDSCYIQHFPHLSHWRCLALPRLLPRNRLQMPERGSLCQPIRR